MNEERTVKCLRQVEHIRDHTTIEQNTKHTSKKINGCCIVNYCPFIVSLNIYIYVLILI